jgi:hypothetical protein
MRSACREAAGLARQRNHRHLAQRRQNVRATEHQDGTLLVRSAEQEPLAETGVQAIVYARDRALPIAEELARLLDPDSECDEKIA